MDARTRFCDRDELAHRARRDRENELALVVQRDQAGVGGVEQLPVAGRAGRARVMVKDLATPTEPLRQCGHIGLFVDDVGGDQRAIRSDIKIDGAALDPGEHAERQAAADAVELRKRAAARSEFGGDLGGTDDRPRQAHHRCTRPRTGLIGLAAARNQAVDAPVRHGCRPRRNDLKTPLQPADQVPRPGDN